MYGRISGTNNEVRKDIAYLTEGTNPLIDVHVYKPTSPGEYIYDISDICKLVYDINATVWPDVPRGRRYIQKEGKSTVIMNGVSFSTASLHRMSILAGLFRTG